MQVSPLWVLIWKHILQGDLPKYHVWGELGFGISYSLIYHKVDLDQLVEDSIVSDFKKGKGFYFALLQWPYAKYILFCPNFLPGNSAKRST